ncbi:MAG: PQQ-binding-like beta-propeller repeat protein [Synergistaceae bacterium]|nr:PQQ-binding-like beta-propeller repeat protein [Synergistaceae bacterium]
MIRKIFFAAITLLLALTAAASAAQRTLAHVDSFISTGVALSGNTLLFGDSVGNFYAAGDTSWTYHDSDATATGIPAVQNDKVIFTQSDGTITCLNIPSGSFVWRYAPVFDESATESLEAGAAFGGEMVYAAYSSGELRAFDLKDGHLVWTYKAKQGLRTAPVYSSGFVFLGEYDGLFSIIDAKTGKRLNGGGAGGAVNTPAVESGNVYYSAWDGSVHAVQLNGVIPLWDAKAGEPVTTSPVIGEGLVVVGTASGKIIAFNQKNGAQVWEYDTKGGQVLASPVVCEGKIFVGTGDGRVLELSAENGKLLREHSECYGLSTSGGHTFYYYSRSEQSICAIN